VYRMFILDCAIPCCVMLFCTIQYCTVLYCSAPYSTSLQSPAVLLGCCVQGSPPHARELVGRRPRAAPAVLELLYPALRDVSALPLPAACCLLPGLQNELPNSRLVCRIPLTHVINCLLYAPWYTPRLSWSNPAAGQEEERRPLDVCCTVSHYIHNIIYLFFVFPPLVHPQAVLESAQQ